MAKSKGKPSGRLLVASNRKARFHYEILDTFEAGMSLKGPEVKSLRENKASFEGAWASVQHGSLVLHNLYIAPYKNNTAVEIPEKRDRRLLMKRKEINKLSAEIDSRKLTLVPLEIYFKRGWAKISLGLARGKRGPDKRASIKKRETERELERSFKGKFKV